MTLAEKILQDECNANNDFLYVNGRNHISPITASNAMKDIAWEAWKQCFVEWSAEMTEGEELQEKLDFEHWYNKQIKT